MKRWRTHGLNLRPETRNEANCYNYRESASRNNVECRYIQYKNQRSECEYQTAGKQN